MMVCSAPANIEARQAIRDTWGSDKKIQGHNLSAYFLVGETNNISMQNDLQLESDQYGDIIQERFVDSYNNLTLKSIQMVKLAANNCLNTTKYLLKIDDDMFVNVPRLVSLILAVNETRNVLMGKLICGARPIKNPSSKWYSPTYMYEDKTYPNYLSGTGYLMSIEVAQKIFEASLSTPIFHLEDVYITGICAKKAKIKPRDNYMFTYKKLSKEPCEFRHLVTMHHFSPQDIRDTFKALNDPKIAQTCAHYKPKVNTRSWLFDNVMKANRTVKRSKCL
ncbi:unnamed protein product [Acanthoscelides obtectus]|uniref:Hexosyltransferase n=1 Tax=Acanthoscelides obtectus TaxID=200917 RepID=A0A9P0MDJ3_ACAOB|nr:unnamed protein product [Acanthoscelides obtectus]